MGRRAVWEAPKNKKQNSIGRKKEAKQPCYVGLVIAI